MTDLALRELERRWRASGTDDDRTLWLVARVRAGDLTLDRVRLAAHAGDASARAAADAPAPPRGLSDWVAGFERWGAEATARVALAAARSALPQLVRGSNPNPELPRLLAAAEAAVLAGPSAAHPARLRLHIGRAEHFATDDAGVSVVEAAQAAHLRAIAAEADVVGPWTLLALQHAQRAAGAAIVRDAVRAAVAPWALGERDPLARR